MSARGFTLLELLVATLVSLLVVAAAVGVAASARRAFQLQPATIDTVRRLHTALDAVAAAVGNAGGEEAISAGGWSMSAALPTVWPLTGLDASGGTGFEAVWVVRSTRGGVGRLRVAQESPSASLTLDPDRSCPRSTPVCGFTDGDIAVVFDGRGAFDLIEVGAVAEALMRVTPRAALSRAYPAGSWIVAVRADRFGLAPQADGSHTLTRVTAAGAREPMVDGVVSMEIEAWGVSAAPVLRERPDGRGVSQYGLAPPAPAEEDPAGVYLPGSHCLASRDAGVLTSTLANLGGAPLEPLQPAQLADGPWCPYPAAPGAYDGDLFRLRRLDIRLRVAVLSSEFRGPAGVLFTRAGTAAEASKWVPDRTLGISVTVGR